MTDITFEIHAWRKETGPAYVKRTHRPGFSNRRNRFSEEEVGARGGLSVESADYYLLDAADAEVWAFNKGHRYILDTIVDGEHEVKTVVDATDGYQTLTVPEGVEIVAISPAEDVHLGDDEDAAEQPDAGASDEEE